MFGEQTIILEEEIKIDEKRRIRIPSSTKVIAEESVGMIYSKNRDRLLLYSEQEYERILKIAFEILEQKKQDKIYDAKFLRFLQRMLFGKFCFSPEKTDENLRVLLPKQAVEMLEFQTIVYVVGVDTHLEIFKNQETYYKLIKKSI